MSFECVTLAVLLSRVTAHCKWHKSSYSCFTTKFRLHIQKLTTSSRIIPHTSTEQVSPTHPDRGTKRPQHKGIPVWEASLILGASSPQQRWKKNKIRARDFGRAIPSAPLGASSTRPAWEHISPRFCIVSAPAQCAPMQRALNAMLTQSFVHLLVLKKILHRQPGEFFLLLAHPCKV